MGCTPCLLIRYVDMGMLIRYVDEGMLIATKVDWSFQKVKVSNASQDALWLSKGMLL